MSLCRTCRGPTDGARPEAELYEIKRQVFVSAVSGNEKSHATIEDVVAGRLDELESARTTEAKLQI
jgi:hypothetical protein